MFFAFTHFAFLPSAFRVFASRVLRFHLHAVHVVYAVDSLHTIHAVHAVHAVHTVHVLLPTDIHAFTQSACVSALTQVSLFVQAD